MVQSNNLTDEHIDHLQNIGYGGLMRKVTPRHVESHFLEMGYVRRAVGGLMITDAGHKAMIDWDNGGN